MVEYTSLGLKMSFPENFNIKGNLPCIYLKDSETSNAMEIMLLDQNTNFEDECQIQFNPDNTWEHKIWISRGKKTLVKAIKFGDCSTHPEAKERWYGVEKSEIDEQEIKLWLLLIPVGKRIISICIETAGTGSVLGNMWQQIIDSMEFDHDLIAGLPGYLEEMKNAPKIEYSSKSLKVIYSAILNQKGGISSFKITHPVLPMSHLSLELCKDEIPSISASNYSSGPRTEVIDGVEVSIEPDYTPNQKIEVVRDIQIIGDGSNLKFTGGRELVTKWNRHNGVIFYNWELLVPVGKDWVYIEVYSYTLEELESIWQPIVESIEFDAKVVSKLPDEEDARKQNWKKTTAGQSQHVHVEFDTIEHFVGLYAAKGKLFTKSELDDDTVVMNLIEDKWYKKSKRLLLSIGTDPLAIPVDIYLNTDSPAENDPAWDQIIEGFINFSTGKMFAAPGYYDSDPSLEIVLPQKGIYKFRIYYGGLSSKTFTEEHWQIYLWPTDETKESNEIKVIKAFTKS